MKERGNLAALDGLRGLAALVVVAFHFRLTCGRVAEPSWFALGMQPFRFGYAGVNLFLVLSGFCLTLSLIRRREAGRGPTLRGFLADRWRRIAPPFYAAMALYLAAGPMLERLGVPPTGAGSRPGFQVATHLLFLHGLRAETICGINDPFWSLSLEFQFYATLPLLFTLGLRLGPWRVLAAVAAVSILWRAWILGVLPDRFHAINGLFPARWAEFMLGSAVASWYADPARRPGPRAARALAASALAMLTLASWLAFRDQVLWSDYAFGVGFGAMLAAALAPSGRRSLGSLLARRPLVWAGERSYSLYLTHSLVLALVLAGYRAAVRSPNSATDLAALATATAASLAAAWAFHRAFERPWLGRRPIAAPVAVTLPSPA